MTIKEQDPLPHNYAYERNNMVFIEDYEVCRLTLEAIDFCKYNFSNKDDDEIITAYVTCGFNELVFHKAFEKEWNNKELKWYKKGTLLNRTKGIICIDYELLSLDHMRYRGYNVVLNTKWIKFNEKDWVEE